jgi:hypothetical protein
MTTSARELQISARPKKNVEDLIRRISHTLTNFDNFLNSLNPRDPFFLVTIRGCKRDRTKEAFKMLMLLRTTKFMNVPLVNEMCILLETLIEKLKISPKISSLGVLLIVGFKNNTGEQIGSCFYPSMFAEGFTKNEYFFDYTVLPIMRNLFYPNVVKIALYIDDESIFLKVFNGVKIIPVHENLIDCFSSNKMELKDFIIKIVNLLNLQECFIVTKSWICADELKAIFTPNNIKLHMLLIESSTENDDLLIIKEMLNVSHIDKTWSPTPKECELFNIDISCNTNLFPHVVDFVPSYMNTPFIHSIVNQCVYDQQNCNREFVMQLKHQNCNRELPNFVPSYMRCPKSKPAESKPAESKPAEIKSAEIKSAESESKPAIFVPSYMKGRNESKPAIFVPSYMKERN